MEIRIADVCGLCAGCKRAIITTQEERKKGHKITIFKEIVHNKNVNNLLQNLGANTEEDINKLTNDGVVIIRAHGEPPETYNYLKDRNINFVDCTCFNVEKIHKGVENFYSLGYTIIILGKHKNKFHPEVLGTLGWAKNEAILVQDEEDLIKLNDVNKKMYLVCQTTFNINKADVLIEKISDFAKEKNLDLIVNKSICNANILINNSSKELAKNCDVMIVVGGKNSSNTKELFNNIKTICPTIMVEDIKDYKHELMLNNILINLNSKIGITAGASTMREELFKLKGLIEKDYEKSIV